MKIRRVVVARDETGKSAVVSDGHSPREQVLKHTPGFVSSPLWLTSGTPDLSLPIEETMAGEGSVLAGPGGACFMVVTFPPDSVMAGPDFDPALAGPEHARAAPGIAETFERDAPGMHRTPTLDFAIVVTGEIVLELDDGAMVTLRQGDTVVQQGTRHAWRNLGAEPATLSFVMLGAQGT